MAAKINTVDQVLLSLAKGHSFKMRPGGRKVGGQLYLVYDKFDSSGPTTQAKDPNFPFWPLMQAVRQCLWKGVGMIISHPVEGDLLILTYGGCWSVFVHGTSQGDPVDSEYNLAAGSFVKTLIHKNIKTNAVSFVRPNEQFLPGFAMSTIDHLCFQKFGFHPLFARGLAANPALPQILFCNFTPDLCGGLGGLTAWMQQMTWYLPPGRKAMDCPQVRIPDAAWESFEQRKDLSPRTRASAEFVARLRKPEGRVQV